jgi:hypothetical protein
MKQQRSTLEKRNVLEEGQKRACCGSTELAIVVARRSWREISLWKTGDPKNGEHPNPTYEKLTKFREYLSQSR